MWTGKIVSITEDQREKGNVYLLTDTSEIITATLSPSLKVTHVTDLSKWIPTDLFTNSTPPLITLDHLSNIIYLYIPSCPTPSILAFDTSTLQLFGDQQIDVSPIVTTFNYFQGFLYLSTLSSLYQFSTQNQKFALTNQMTLMDGTSKNITSVDCIAATGSLVVGTSEMGATMIKGELVVIDVQNWVVSDRATVSDDEGYPYGKVTTILANRNSACDNNDTSDQCYVLVVTEFHAKSLSSSPSIVVVMDMNEE